MACTTRSISRAAALLAILLFPAALLAHTRLTASNPREGQAVASSPSEIRLTFSERPEIALASIIIVSGTDTVSLRGLRTDSADRNTLVVTVGRILAPGSYRILWRIAGMDGHPIRGAVAFSVTARDRYGEAISQAADTPAASPIDDGESAAMPAFGGALTSVLVRWIAFVSAFLVIGVVTFRKLVLDRMTAGATETFRHIASNNAATLGLASAIGAVFAAMLKLARESSDMPDLAMMSMLLGSTWGWSLFAQMVAGLVGVAGFRAAHSDRPAAREMGWSLALTAALVLGIAPSLGGHAIAGERAYIAVPADILHVIAGSAWLGTLAVILIVGIPAALKAPDDIRPGARVAGLINVFSPLALMCGGSVVATGLGSSVMRLGSPDALWTTPYGVVLLVKLTFVVLLFGAGAWNWRRLKPRLTGDDAIAPLRSSARLELVLAGAVLGATAILVALELP